MAIYPHHSSHTLSRGFTLIELMAATAIFLGGMTAVLVAQSTAQNVNTMAHHYTIGGMVAENLLEGMTLLPDATLHGWGSLDQSYDVNGQLLTGPSPEAFFTATATKVPTINPPVRVRVSVKWTEPSTRQAQNLTVDNVVPQ